MGKLPGPLEALLPAADVVGGSVLILHVLAAGHEGVAFAVLEARQGRDVAVDNPGGAYREPPNKQEVKMPNMIGYARVSTDEQMMALQLDALRQAGCARIFEETASGASAKDRVQLQAVLEYLNPGDTLAVWRLDRLGRSVKDLIELVDDLQDRRINFSSLTENIDTKSSAGRLVFHVFAALAQMERELISERTKAGLEAARRQGRRGGRPPVLTEEQIEGAVELRLSGSSVSSIARTLHCARDTVRRALNKKEVD